MSLSDEQAKRLLKERFPDVAESVRRRNPEIYGELVAAEPVPTMAGQRIRQRSKPLMNKLEYEFWHDYLEQRYPEAKPQALRFRLANGLTLTPDFADLSVQPVKAWEVKGKHAWEDSLVKLKAAAAIWKEVRWVLVWKKDGQWHQQEVLA